MTRIEFGILRQKVAEMVQQAILLAGGGRLWQLGVVAPRAEVRRRNLRRDIAGFRRNQEAAGRRQQVGVLAIPPIEKVDRPISYWQFAQEDVGRFTLAEVGQEPAKIALAGGWRRDAGEVDLHLIIRPLIALQAHLPAAYKRYFADGRNR